MRIPLPGWEADGPPGVLVLNAGPLRAVVCDCVWESGVGDPHGPYQVLPGEGASCGACGSDREAQFDAEDELRSLVFETYRKLGGVSAIAYATPHAPLDVIAAANAAANAGDKP